MSGSSDSRRRRVRPARVKPRKPMPRKPPKVEVPDTVYRRRLKHRKRSETEQ